jgi:hypothetical protein
MLGALSDCCLLISESPPESFHSSPRPAPASYGWLPVASHGIQESQRQPAMTYDMPSGNHGVWPGNYGLPQDRQPPQSYELHMTLSHLRWKEAPQTISQRRDSQARESTDCGRVEGIERKQRKHGFENLWTRLEF